MRIPFQVIIICFIFCSSIQARAASGTLPNIVLILADDLGYGDVSCYNPDSKVPTPHLDQLAADGLRFTDAHSPSTVCTPTRYSILTGRMAFRNGMKGVFTGAGGPDLIEDGRMTIAQLLKNQGYATAMFGKWHIGLTFRDHQGNPINENGLEAVKRIDYSQPITDGPIHRGFDHFFGTACCPTTDWLYAWIDGDRIPVPPTGLIDKTNLPTHEWSFDCRPGMIAPDFDLEEVDQVFLEKSKAFLEKHAAESPDQPFFLFHSMQAVHLPSFPGDAFKGKTDAGPHGDFIHETDHIVGELVATLKKHNLYKNTLILFTSDNGPETGTTVNMRTKYDHDGAKPWRGVKRDQWEGGHRIPTIACWHAHLDEPGRVTDQTFSGTDIFATFAAAAGLTLEIPEDAAEDSFNFLPVIEGHQSEDKPIRPYTLHQTIKLDLAIRRGPWKYLDHQGSGGNSYAKGKMQPYALPEKAPDAPGQLYNLDDDPGETTNLYFEHPEIVADLKKQLDASVASGRSR